MHDLIAVDRYILPQCCNSQIRKHGNRLSGAWSSLDSLDFDFGHKSGASADYALATVTF